MTMLRLRTQSGPRETLLIVEGRLTTPWVDELARYWAKLREEANATPVRIDLDGVTFVSAAGKELLARLHAEGAVLTARACMTSAIIDEIIEEILEEIPDSERGE
jgi:anti-anti-sigma regulatory factor